MTNEQQRNLAKSNDKLTLYIVSVFTFESLKSIVIIGFYKKKYPLICLLEKVT